MGEKIVFDDLTPLHPTGRLFLEKDSAELETRIMDLVTPIGKGQKRFNCSASAYRENSIITKNRKQYNEESS